MSKVLVTKNKIDLLANAISAKSGESLTLTLDEMIEAVDEIETGTTPTGNIDITSSGVTDVTEYATATVAEAIPLIQIADSYYNTWVNARKWNVRAKVVIDSNDENPSGYIDDGTYYGSYETYNAVPANTTITPTESAQTIGGANYMMEGAVTVNAVPSANFNVSASNVVNGYYTDSGVLKWRYCGVVDIDPETGGNAGYINEGEYVGNYIICNAINTGTSVTPTESAQTIGGSNTMMRGAVTVNAISSSYVGSGITRRDSTDLTASGATVSVPSGYYASNASKSVSSGTEGTPTATKGSVSNHAVTVTPSVTNTAGYISGGTKTGTGVSVSALELVSGTYTVDSSGTKDVTNYASASVPSGTAGTPSASKGTVSNHSISVTPSVTNTTGWITGSTKTGTAVTVSASELVSGSETKTSNGTYDVTNLAELVVNVSSSTPAISIVDTTDSVGGTIRTITALDISDTTAVASDVASGKYFYTAQGQRTAGTGSGGSPSATQYSIYLEFNDSTSTTVPVYYNDSLLGTMITAYQPSTWTYNNKTVTLAELDGVTWYDKQNIPIGVELIDYNACIDDYIINASGQAVSQQWYVASDYTPIESGMTFSFRGCRWYYLAYYDSSEGFISSSNIDNISTPDPNDSNVGIGTLSSGIPTNAKYIRITGTGAYSSRLSLIRTA